MNDRELLELAARAAGYKLSWSYDNHCCWINEMRHDFDVTWNPRDDDGDALRLAVKLGIVVTPDRENQRTLVSNTASSRDSAHQQKRRREGRRSGGYAAIAAQ